MRGKAHTSCKLCLDHSETMRHVIYDQPGGVMVDVGYGAQQLIRFGLAWALAHPGRSSCTQGVYATKILFENFSVKEQKRIKCLILGGG